MLTNEQIEKNKIEFLKLISEITIEDADTQGLVDFLDSTDFFEAPASTKYHCSYKGGLCEHSLHVYKSMVNLADMYQDYLPDINKNSLLVVGLLHDISKANFYEPCVINKKKYSEKGLKHDNIGSFDWFAEEAYKVREVEDRFLAGTHEVASSIIVSRYIPLSLEENLAILYHQPIPSDGQPIREMSFMLNKYPLITLVQLADYSSCFILERIK